MCGGQRLTCENLESDPMWFPGIKLKWSVSVTSAFTYAWSHLTNLREPFYLTYFCSEVKDERRKFNLRVSQGRVCVANDIYVTSKFLQEFSNAVTVSCIQLSLSAWLSHSTVASIRWKQAWEKHFVIICLFL